MQFIEKIVELMIILINNIRNITNNDIVLKLTSKKHLIMSERRYWT